MISVGNQKGLCLLELPGCSANGRTYREALTNAETIIQEWIETAKELGRPIPSPKGRLVLPNQCP